VEVWQTSSLRQLRLGKKKDRKKERKKERRRNHRAKNNGLPDYIGQP